MIRNIFMLTLFSCGVAPSQQPPASAAPLAFEVASIRPHQGPLHVINGFWSSGSHLTLEGYTRMDLILEAYNLKRYQVTWKSEADSQDDIYYDLVAKAEGNAAPTRSEFRLMLRTLLAQPPCDIHIHLPLRVEHVTWRLWQRAFVHDVSTKLRRVIHSSRSSGSPPVRQSMNRPKMNIFRSRIRIQKLDCCRRAQVGWWAPRLKCPHYPLGGINLDRLDGTRPIAGSV
jgi:hypothetical protein